MHPIHPGRRSNRMAQSAAFFTVSALSTLTLLGSSEVQLPPRRIKVGDKAPDFALPSADGKTVRLSDFASHNVLIDFYRGYW